MTSSTSQPKPTTNKSSVNVATSVAENLPKWLAERNAKGLATYGTHLHTFNGRDAIQDEREELLDALQYNEQNRLERDRLKHTLLRYYDADNYERQVNAGHECICVACDQVHNMFETTHDLHYVGATLDPLWLTHGQLVEHIRTLYQMAESCGPIYPDKCLYCSQLTPDQRGTGYSEHNKACPFTTDDRKML